MQNMIRAEKTNSEYFIFKIFKLEKQNYSSLVFKTSTNVEKTN